LKEWEAIYTKGASENKTHRWVCVRHISCAVFDIEGSRW
jgi:hypothetical protein